MVVNFTTIYYVLIATKLSEIGQFPWKIGLFWKSIEEFFLISPAIFRELYGDISRKKIFINLLNKFEQSLAKDWTIIRIFRVISRRNQILFFDDVGLFEEKNRTNVLGKFRTLLVRSEGKITIDGFPFLQRSCLV